MYDCLIPESTMGDSYNTQKFLQENELNEYARNEPLILMSKENQDLQKVVVFYEQLFITIICLTVFMS